jgi:TatD DNase family protein
MQLIDTHCHLTSLEHQPLDTILANANRCGVNRFVCIGASDGIASAAAAVALAAEHDSIWASIGIHPHDAGDYQTLDLLTPLFEHPCVRAIGETGLDFFRDWAPVEAQRTLFRASIETAISIKKPLIIHCRDAATETLQTLIDLKAEQVGGVFHCYAEDATFAKKLRDINFLVSFTGNLTFKKAHALREAAAAIPLEQIMLETDCPYMAPEPFRGSPSEPMHVYQIALKLAEIKGITLEEVAKRTSSNAERFFGL